MQPINEIFDIEYGNQFDFSKMEIEEYSGGINFISRGSSNNGFMAKVKIFKDIEPYQAGLITVTMGGSYLLASFVQPEPFYTAQNIKVLKPKNPMSLGEKLFYCAAIQHNRFRYHSHSREANSTFDSISVPSVVEIPSEYRMIAMPPLNNRPCINKEIVLTTNTWKPFSIGSLFKIVKGKRLTKADMIDGDIPFIGATAKNNGVTAYISNADNIHPANLITVSYNGSVGFAFYQPKPFVASDDINVLYPRFSLNVYIAIFLCNVISVERYRYNYGRKWDKDSMEGSCIYLPTKNDKPDWEYMENFIKSLPYSKQI